MSHFEEASVISRRWGWCGDDDGWGFPRGWCGRSQKVGVDEERGGSVALVEVLLTMFEFAIW